MATTSITPLHEKSFVKETYGVASFATMIMFFMYNSLIRDTGLDWTGIHILSFLLPVGATALFVYRAYWYFLNRYGSATSNTILGVFIITTTFLIQYLYDLIVF
ncbi:MAG: hypothetical protein CL946_05930 [Ectothiorhodospiraceae bacterium]|nr:hypothetical protein [Ectothiorhodospiraceae bacterium]